MCEFCDVLINECRDKEITWQVRSTYADDNINEYLDLWDERCVFKLNSHIYKDDVYVGVEYKQEIVTSNENIIIWPFSEAIQFNYCPICGKQISKNLKKFEDYYQHQISLDDK